MQMCFAISATRSDGSLETRLNRTGDEDAVRKARKRHEPALTHVLHVTIA